MKKRNRFLALMLATAVSMSMAACGNSETSKEAGVEADADAGSDAAEDADAEAPAEQEEADPFAAAQENMKTITSLDALMVMEMDMVVSANGQEQSVESVTTMDMSCFYEPLRMRWI